MHVELHSPDYLKGLLERPFYNRYHNHLREYCSMDIARNPSIHGHKSKSPWCVPSLVLPSAILQRSLIVRSASSFGHRLGRKLLRGPRAAWIRA